MSKKTRKVTVRYLKGGKQFIYDRKKFLKLLSPVALSIRSTLVYHAVEMSNGNLAFRENKLDELVDLIPDN